MENFVDMFMYNNIDDMAQKIGNASRLFGEEALGGVQKAVKEAGENFVQRANQLINSIDNIKLGGMIPLAAGNIDVPLNSASMMDTPELPKNQQQVAFMEAMEGKNGGGTNVSDVVESGADVVEVKLSKSKYPESTKHIKDAIKNGQPDTLTINGSGAKENRKASLKGIKKVPGADLDEYPPAMFKEGGNGASVRPINSSDNRGSGSTMGHQLRIYPDGTKVKIKIEE